MRDRSVYDYALESDVKAKGGKVIGTRWVDRQKGLEVRSRFVGQEFADGDPRDDLFAGTPPLWLARLLVSMAASDRSKYLMSLDVSCAFLYAPMEREIFIKLPPEDPWYGMGYVGRLLRALYGTRDAPLAWQKELSRTMRKLGFVVSKLHPSVYYHPRDQTWAVCHVDDILLFGGRSNLSKFKSELARCYKISGDFLEAGCEITYLGRTIGLDDNGYTWTADTKHVNMLLEETGLKDCKPVETPFWTEPTPEERDSQQSLHGSEATRFRRHVARISYLSQDRIDLCVAANKLSRLMSNPKTCDDIALKRVARYLKGKPFLSIRFDWQASSPEYRSLSDSDWASDVKTRRSTSGGMIFRGSHLLNFWCKLQGGVALSSGEAELTSLVKASCELTCVLNLIEELEGWRPRGTALCDSSAARGTAHRIGVGQLKHVSVKHLWVQELVSSRKLTVAWISRKFNPADFLTHSLSGTSFNSVISSLPLCVRPPALSL